MSTEQFRQVALSADLCATVGIAYTLARSVKVAKPRSCVPVATSWSRAAT